MIIKRIIEIIWKIKDKNEKYDWRIPLMPETKSIWTMEKQKIIMATKINSLNALSELFE